MIIEEDEIENEVTSTNTIIMLQIYQSSASTVERTGRCNVRWYIKNNNQSKKMIVGDMNGDEESGHLQ